MLNDIRAAFASPGFKLPVLILFLLCAISTPATANGS